MPSRTIKHAFFIFTGADGRRVWAQRAETHDIPEGEDLERGDKLGAFTEDGSEPSAPPGTFIPDPDVAWDKQEWEDWVDAGKINEIISKVNAVAPEQRGQVAAQVIQAEHGRKDKARAELLTAMAQISDGTVAPSASVDTSSDNDISLLSDEELARWISRNSTEAVLAAVGTNAALADEVRLAEQDGNARPELLVRLNELVGSAVRGEIVTTQLPAPGGGLERSDQDQGGEGSQSEDNDGEGGDLADFVASHSTDEILAEVGDDKAKADEVASIENARSKPRKGLLDGLAKITEG